MRIGRRWSWVLRLGVSAAVLTLVVWQIPWGMEFNQAHVVEHSSATAPGKADAKASPTDLPRNQHNFSSVLANANPLWLFAAFAIMASMTALLAVRWRGLLLPHAQAASWRWVGVHVARAQVLTLLPFGQIGGDGYRIERSVRMGVRPVIAGGIVVLERLLGLAALSVVAGLGLAARASITGAGGTDAAVVLSLVTGLVVAVPASLFCTARLANARGGSSRGNRRAIRARPASTIGAQIGPTVTGFAC